MATLVGYGYRCGRCGGHLMFDNTVCECTYHDPEYGRIPCDDCKRTDVVSYLTDEDNDVNLFAECEQKRKSIKTRIELHLEFPGVPNDERLASLFKKIRKMVQEDALIQVEGFAGIGTIQVSKF